MIEQDYEPEPVPAYQPTLNEIQPPVSFKPEMAPTESLLSQEPTTPRQAHWNVDLPVMPTSLETAPHALRALLDDEAEDEVVAVTFLAPAIPHEIPRPREELSVPEPIQLQAPAKSPSPLKTRSTSLMNEPTNVTSPLWLLYQQQILMDF